jgi:hypothetical protein
MLFMASFNKVMIYYLYMRALVLFFFTNARIGTAFPYCICYNIYWKAACKSIQTFRGFLNVKLGKDLGRMQDKFILLFNGLKVLT